MPQQKIITLIFSILLLCVGCNRTDLSKQLVASENYPNDNKKAREHLALLSKEEQKEILADLLLALESPADSTRIKAILAIEVLKDLAKTTIPKMLPLLKDPNYSVRATAITFLAKHDPESLLPFLGALLQDSNQWVRRTTISQLPKIGPKVRAYLHLINPNREQWYVATQIPPVLGKIGGIEAAKILINMLHQKSCPENRILEALGQIGPTAQPFLPVLLEKLKGNPLHLERHSFRKTLSYTILDICNGSIEHHSLVNALAEEKENLEFKFRINWILYQLKKNSLPATIQFKDLLEQTDPQQQMYTTLELIHRFQVSLDTKRGDTTFGVQRTKIRPETSFLIDQLSKKPALQYHIAWLLGHTRHPSQYRKRGIGEKELRALCKNQNSEVRSQAIQSLYSISLDTDAITVFIDALDDPSAKVRLEGVIGLSSQLRLRRSRRRPANWKARPISTNKIRTETALEKTLTDKNSNIRYLSAFALADSQPKKAFPIIKEALKSSSAEIRLQATVALKETRLPEAIELLIQVIDQDKNRRIRTEAILAFLDHRSPLTLPSSSVAVFTRILDNTKDPLKYNAVIALKLLALPIKGTSAAGEALLKAFEKMEDLRFTRSLGTVLGELSYTKAIPILKKALSDKRQHVKRCAATSLHSFGPLAKDCLEEIKQIILHNSDDDLRNEIMFDLIRIGPDSLKLTPEIVEALKEPSYQVRLASFYAIKSLRIPLKTLYPHYLRVFKFELFLMVSLCFFIIIVFFGYLWWKRKQLKDLSKLRFAGHLCVKFFQFLFILVLFAIVLGTLFNIADSGNRIIEPNNFSNSIHKDIFWTLIFLAKDKRIHILFIFFGVAFASLFWMTYNEFKKSQAKEKKILHFLRPQLKRKSMALIRKTFILFLLSLVAFALLSIVARNYKNVEYNPVVLLIASILKIRF